jgi:drug/metabolite transporter (DMT)-like permease
MTGKDYLDPRAVVIITILTLLWGFNYTAVKYSNEGISPVFASTLRSFIACLCGVAYCLYKEQKLFHTDIMLFHGFVVGLLFGLEFACIYFGLLYTDASRSVVFVYMSPFVVAVGAHFFGVPQLFTSRSTWQKRSTLLIHSCTNSSSRFLSC